jgi:hypothetical protein
VNCFKPRDYHFFLLKSSSNSKWTDKNAPGMWDPDVAVIFNLPRLSSSSPPPGRGAARVEEAPAPAPTSHESSFGSTSCGSDWSFHSLHGEVGFHLIRSHIVYTKYRYLYHFILGSHQIRDQKPIDTKKPRYEIVVIPNLHLLDIATLPCLLRQSIVNAIFYKRWWAHM